MPKLLGERVYERREELRYQQNDVAKMCNISRDKLSRIERNITKKPIPQELLESLAEVLQCSPDYLTGDSDNPQENSEGYEMPFIINHRAVKAIKLYELAEKDYQFVNDLIFMQEHFSAEEIDIVKRLVSFLRNNHKDTAAFIVEKDPE